MRHSILPCKSISLIGRSLQALFPESFTESHVNIILRSLVKIDPGVHQLNHKEQIEVANRVFHLKMFSGSGKEDFQEFNNNLLQNTAGRNHRITIELEPPINFFDNPKNITINTVTDFINELIFVMQHGVWNINAKKLRSGKNSSTPGNNSELVRLISVVAHTANPDVIFTE
ncbi:MAG: hypothetical protein R6W78_04040 [Bacteroidales bacterium]